jgi:hypothetical protein
VETARGAHAAAPPGGGGRAVAARSPARDAEPKKVKRDACPAAPARTMIALRMRSSTIFHVRHDI